MIPEPTFSFTIPSVHDDTTLDCRIYHPPTSTRQGPGEEKPWRSRGAIIAHPYATLGGSYDDYIVLSTVVEILREGFVVGTFNFRGAGSSKGRTSWSATPEISDYISFVGFFVYYVVNLYGTTSHISSQNDPDTALSPIPSIQADPSSTTVTTYPQGMILILGGYSYGSLITKLLPDTESMLNRFINVTMGSAEAEIRLRALHLSTQWNKDALAKGRSRREKTSRAQEKAVVIGGDESDLGARRPSRDSRRSVDTIRRSVEFSKRKLGLQHTSNAEAGALPLESSLLPDEVTLPSSFYLLISPLRPPISSFITMFSKARHHGSGSHPSPANLQAHNLHITDQKLANNLTLVVYGDSDVFTSQKKLRKWVEGLAGRSSSSFQFREIAGAGHFWQEEGVEAQLRTTVRDWVKVVLSR